MALRSVLGLVLALNALAIGAGIAHYAISGVDYFKEGAFLTIFSVIQLLVIARIAQKIRQVRNAPKTKFNWRNPSAVWAIISIGFYFLAADELFLLHENMDTLIHWIFHIKQTGLTTRIDDVIVGLYGLAGIGVLYAYRSELKHHRKAIPYIVAGFVLLFAMVALDLLTHRDDILRLFYEYDTARFIRDCLSKTEEAFKVIAEALYITAFYAILQKVRQMEKGPDL